MPHLDLLPVFRGFSPAQLTVNPFDAHPNEFANELAAKAIDCVSGQPSEQTVRITIGTRFGERPLKPYATPAHLTGNRTNLDGFDAHAAFLQPFDGGFDLGAFAIEFEADDADFIGDAGLADVGGRLNLWPNCQTSGLVMSLGGYINHKRVCCGVCEVVGVGFFFVAMRFMGWTIHPHPVPLPLGEGESVLPVVGVVVSGS